MNFDFNNKKILVVDDEELIREVLVEAFQTFGADVKQAESGNAAFEAVKNEHFDVVMTDVRMPNGDGIAFIKKASQLPNFNSKIFICSAFNDLIKDDLVSLKIVKLFNKPFDLDMVLKDIQDSLGLT